MRRITFRSGVESESRSLCAPEVLALANQNGDHTRSKRTNGYLDVGVSIQRVFRGYVTYRRDVTSDFFPLLKTCGVN